jgi:hypothetical protein
MRTQLKICTEADYLQAHLTVIQGESSGRKLTLHNVNQRATSILMKLLLAANAKLTAKSNPLLRLRAINDKTSSHRTLPNAHGGKGGVRLTPGE